MIRITGGNFKGRTLKLPKGLKIRPTRSKVREAMFNILGSRVTGARVLDLFAGSGLLGLEALSRGAEQVFFVEQDKTNCRTLKNNVATLVRGPSHPILCNPAHRAIRQLSQSGIDFDIVLMDPPYAQDIQIILKALLRGRLVRPEGWIIVERSRHTTDLWPEELTEIKTRTYGYTRITILKPIQGQEKGERHP